MHELAIADEDAHMREGHSQRVEEHKVSRLEFGFVNRATDPAHLVAATRQSQSGDLAEHKPHQAAAIKPCRRTVATETVIHAKQ